MPSIVQINISEAVAPTPITLQSTGAAISQGATTLADNAYSFLTQASDLTALLAPPLALSALAWSGGTVVVTTAAAIPGLNTGDVFITTIAGVTPTGYNGTYACIVTGGNTFTYVLATNPGTETGIGTFTPPNQGELFAMVATFFAQSGAQGMYVLELGAGDATGGPSDLLAFANANPGIFYAYLVPRGWDGSSGLLALIAAFGALASKTYFYVTTTTSTYQTYTSAMKCVVSEIEAPGLPLTEFSLASAFQHNLAYNPSSTNRMTPTAFSFLFGVTSYPTVGNNTLLTAVKAASTNYVGTGAEGGISTAILLWGTTEDGNDFSWWYSADWIQLNSDLAISNTVINGSNNPLAPLYYNQPGINVLQDVVVATVQNAITYGLANGTVTRTTLDPVTFGQNLNNGIYAGQNVVNAVPFSVYTAANPGDYAKGVYKGFTCVYIPQRGFTNITFNILVTQLLSQ